MVGLVSDVCVEGRMPMMPRIITFTVFLATKLLVHRLGFHYGGKPVPQETVAPSNKNTPSNAGETW